MFLWNILIAVVWCWLQGNFSTANMIGGFVLGYIVLLILTRQGLTDKSRYVARFPKAIGLFFFFIKELFIANIRIAWELLTPGLSIKPAIIAMPLDAKTDAEITLIASLITLTPGTLSMEVSEDKSTLFIHAIYCDDEEALIQELKQGFERKVLEVLR